MNKSIKINLLGDDVFTIKIKLILHLFLDFINAIIFVFPH